MEKRIAALNIFKKMQKINFFSVCRLFITSSIVLSQFNTFVEAQQCPPPVNCACTVIDDPNSCGANNFCVDKAAAGGNIAEIYAVSVQDCKATFKLRAEYKLPPPCGNQTPGIAPYDVNNVAAYLSIVDSGWAPSYSQSQIHNLGQVLESKKLVIMGGNPTVDDVLRYEIDPTLAKPYFNLKDKPRLTANQKAVFIVASYGVSPQSAGKIALHTWVNGPNFCYPTTTTTKTTTKTTSATTTATTTKTTTATTSATTSATKSATTTKSPTVTGSVGSTIAGTTYATTTQTTSRTPSATGLASTSPDTSNSMTIVPSVSQTASLTGSVSPTNTSIVNPTIIYNPSYDPTSSLNPTRTPNPTSTEPWYCWWCPNPTGTNVVNTGVVPDPTRSTDNTGTSYPTSTSPLGTQTAIPTETLAADRDCEVDVLNAPNSIQNQAGQSGAENGLLPLGNAFGIANENGQIPPPEGIGNLLDPDICVDLLLVYNPESNPPPSTQNQRVIQLPTLGSNLGTPAVYILRARNKWEKVQQQRIEDGTIIFNPPQFGYYQVYAAIIKPRIDFGDIYVYPNPTKSGQTPTLHIEVNVKPAEMSFRIYDIAGDLAYESKVETISQFTNGKLTYEIPLDPKLFKSATYLGSISSKIDGKEFRGSFRFTIIK
ncbi:MAG: hypothetical protein ACKVQC_08175 [Elusimicrobiota bacterium]